MSNQRRRRQFGPAVRVSEGAHETFCHEEEGNDRDSGWEVFMDLKGGSGGFSTV